MADDSVYELSSSESDDGVADDDVDGMIKKMVENNPQFNKFMVMSPELMKQKEKNRKAKERRLEREENAKLLRRPMTMTRLQRPKRAKNGKAKAELEDDSDPPTELTGYIHVLKPLPALPPPKFAQHEIQAGSSDHANLRRMHRTIIPVYICQSNTPQFWDTNDDNDGNKAEAGPSDGVFDYTELEARTTEESVNEQKMSFDRSVAPYVEELKERWPENDAGKRIYTDELGYQWELNTIRLSIWASHIVRVRPGKTATLDKAPLSSQFDIKYRLKNQPPAPVLPPAHPSLPQPVAANPAPSASDQTSRDSYRLNTTSASAPAAPIRSPRCPSCTTNPIIKAPSLRPPPSPVKLNHRYHFDRLQKLEYEPGDHEIVGLGRDDWQEFAGFSKLAWNKVLSTHNQFLTDIRAGLWA
ncbi:hypothetical protein B0H14DRAFT_2579866 [Mycena olivaceomarginata]|nr:hypothetical protein B0H14DRAFT_2579866 [Mycena olivaceomarginata]